MTPLLLVALLVAGAVLSSGCRRTRLPNLPIRVNVAFATTADLNSGSDTEARPRATRVQVYQLRDRSAFTVIDRGTFWENEREALGAQLVKVECGMQLFPEQTEECAFTVEEATRFIGVAADLYDPVEDQWRAVYPIDDLQLHRLNVSIDADVLSTDTELMVPGRNK
ncbi:MAG: type VI secretion system lipoprotein TssJ [Bacteroidota bacterium]